MFVQKYFIKTSLQQFNPPSLLDLLKQLSSTYHPFIFHPQPPLSFQISLHASPGQPSFQTINQSFYNSNPTAVIFRDEKELFIYSLVFKQTHKAAGVGKIGLSLQMTYHLLQYHGQNFVPSQSNLVQEGQNLLPFKGKQVKSKIVLRYPNIGNYILRVEC